MDANDCLICLYESYPSEAEREAFVAAVLEESARNPKGPVLVCNTHFTDMALLAGKLADVL